MPTKLLTAIGSILLLMLASCSDQGTTPSGDNTGGGTKPSISIADAPAAAEGDNATFVVTLSGATTQDVTVHYTLVDLSTTDADFTGSLSGTLTIPAGSATGNIVLSVANDTTAEGTELYHVVLSSPTNATLAQDVAKSQIAPNDGGVDVSYATQLLPLFTTKGCTDCHGGNGGLFVTSVSSLLTTGDHKPDVIPGLGGQSNLYLKTTDNWPFGSRMPLVGGTLSADEQKLIRDWIDQGAQNN